MKPCVSFAVREIVVRCRTERSSLRLYSGIGEEARANSSRTLKTLMQGLGFIFWAEVNHDIIFNIGDSGSNWLVRRIVLVKDVLVISKTRERQRKWSRKIQHTQGRKYNWTSQRSRTRNDYQYQALLLSLSHSLTTRYLVSSLCFIVLSLYTCFSNCKANP